MDTRSKSPDGARIDYNHQTNMHPNSTETFSKSARLPRFRENKNPAPQSRLGGALRILKTICFLSVLSFIIILIVPLPPGMELPFNVHKIQTYSFVQINPDPYENSWAGGESVNVSENDNMDTTGESENDTKTSESPETESEFLKLMQTFPWEPFIESIEKENLRQFADSSSKLLFDMLPFLGKEPHVPINESCAPPLLQFPDYVEPCIPLKTGPRKVAILLQEGFNIDALEINFNELDELVDYFFLLEGTSSHNVGMKKPLIWEYVQRQPRFSKFLPKIVHMLVDDSDVVSSVRGMMNASSLLKMGTFGVEHIQEHNRFLKFVKWNNSTKYFGPDDLVGVGDADEIVNRNVVYYMKNCELPSDPVDMGIWYPMGKINETIYTDFPPKGHKYAWGDPTYYTLKSALAAKVANRRRGTSPKSLLGGMHMSHLGYLPFAIAKRVTRSDAWQFHGKFVGREMAPKLRDMKNKDDLRAVEIFMSMPDIFKKRVMNIEVFKRTMPDEYRKIVKFPWFYDCNRNRYPTWEGNPDLRIY